MTEYQEQLLGWYKEHHRKLPWRETEDPYKIWISEVMLQQTQVDTVIDYYIRFLGKFPDIHTLASADEEEVLKQWEGLGYYSRARRLLACAKEVVERYRGIFPKDYKKVLALPGIGPYTAGAILSIAYNMPLPAVDGNVMRAVSRQFNIRDDISKAKSRKIFEKKVLTLLPEDRRHFNQALMELGAMICTPRVAKCWACPMASLCYANLLECQAELPVKTKKITKVDRAVAIAYVKCNNRVLITKRTDEGLLAGLWGFPLAEVKEAYEGVSALEWTLEQTYDLRVDYIGVKNKAKHVFTHLTWHMSLFNFEATQEKYVEYPIMKWVEENELNNYPFPTAFKKLLS